MDCSCINLTFSFNFSFLGRKFTIKMSIYVQKFKNIDRKTLVIFQLPRSPLEKQACFISTREPSTGRHLAIPVALSETLPQCIVKSNRTRELHAR